MRWLPSLVSLSLLAAGSFAATRPAGERFSDYHASSLSSAPLKLEEASYRDMTAAPRDYSAVVLLTAMDARYSCQLCREFQPEWDVLSRSWTRGDKAGNSRVVFGTLDFDDGRNIFMELGLRTAPVLIMFPPTTGPHVGPSTEPVRLEFTSGPQSAEQVHQWLARHTPNRPHPPLRRPFNWVGWGLTVIATLFVLSVLFVIWPYVLPVIQNRNVWAAISLILILLFTSGHMFNHIRKVPYVAVDGRGGVSYFAGGFQNQFGMETQIVAAMYGLLSFIAISLVVKAPRMPDPSAQQVAVLAWSGVLFLMYGFLLSVFRTKNGGYPFALPPFM